MSRKNISTVAFSVILIAGIMAGTIIFAFNSFQKGYERGKSEATTEYVEYFCDTTRDQVQEQFENFGIDGRRLTDYCIKYGRLYGVPPIILAWQITKESSGNPRAVNHYRSRSGKRHTVRGLMQIDWEYWGDFLRERGICDNPEQLYDPERNTHAGAAILAHIAHKYYQGNLYKALGHFWGGNAKTAHIYLEKIMILR